MGKTAREDIENRICECKFFFRNTWNHTNIHVYTYNTGTIIKVFFSVVHVYIRIWSSQLLISKGADYHQSCMNTSIILLLICRI